MGILDDIATRLEQGNPEAVFASAIEAQTARLAEHKDRIAGLAALRGAAQDKALALETELREVMTALTAALAEDDDDVAIVLISRRDELTEGLEARLAEVAEITEQVDTAKAGLVEARDAIETLKNERHVRLAQRAVADAAIDIEDARTGLGESPTAQGLAIVRDTVGALERKAHEGYLDEDGNSVRGRAEAMGRKAAEQSARDQLDVLKRQLAGDDDDDDA